MLRKIVVLSALVTSLACTPGPQVAADKATGEEGGACYPNGTCDAGLVCEEDQCVRAADSGDGGAAVDAGIAVGQEGGACYPNDTCDEGLSCQAGICEAAPPDAGPTCDTSVDGDCDGVLTAADCDDGLDLQVGGMCFAYIPAGTFTMGSPSGELGRHSDETQHQVTFTYDFAMGVTEVTQGQWKAKSGGTNPSYFTSCGDNCPVEQVGWYSTLAYANALSRDAGLEECYTLTPSSCADEVSDWGGGDTSCTGATFVGLSCTGYRLPTEAEWEYAYRAGTTTAYYSGANSVTGCDFDANLRAIGWYCGNENGTTHAVGGKQANAWGLYDMSGNVWEWTWDWYGTYPGVISDYIGPQTGNARVLRGGSWLNNARSARAADRDSRAPGFRGINYGFRLTRTLP